MKPKHILSLALPAAIFAALSSSASAQNTIWTGAAGTVSTVNDWNVAANWSAGIPNTSSAIAIFNDSVLAPQLRNVDFPSALTVNGLTFNSSAQSFWGNTGNAANINYANNNGYTIGLTNNLTLGGTDPTITQSGSGNALVEPNILLPATLTIAGNGAGQLTINRLSNSSTITKTGNSNILISANASPGNGTKWIINGGAVRAEAETRFGGTPAALTADWASLDGGEMRFTANVPNSWSANRGILVGDSGGTLAGIRIDTAVWQINSVIGDVAAETGNLVLRGAGQQGSIRLEGANTFTGVLTVRNTNLALNYGTTSTARFVGTNPLTLNSGRIALTGHASTAVTETFAGTTVSDGYSTLFGTIGTSGTTTLNMGALSRPAAGLLGMQRTTANYVFNTSTPNAFAGTSGSILGGWATVSSATTGTTTAAYSPTDWATNDGSGNLIALAAYDVNSVAANANSLINATQTVSANTTINSLLSNTSGANVNIDAGVELKIASGGVLWRNIAGSGMNIGNVAGQGTLTSGNGRDLILVGEGNGTPTINSVITNDGATPIGLTLGLGPSSTRVVQLAANNTFTGAVNILSGHLLIGGGATADAGDGTVINIGKAGIGASVDPAQLRFAGGFNGTKTFAQDINIFGNHNNATFGVRTSTGSFTANNLSLNLDGNITVDSFSSNIDGPTVAVFAHDRNLNSAVRLGGVTVGAKVLQGSATPGQNVVALIGTSQVGIGGNSLAGGIATLSRAMTINSTIRDGAGGGGLTTYFDGGAGGIAVVKINGNNTFTGAGSFGNGIQPGTNIRNTIALAGNANAFSTAPINLGVVTGAVAANQKQGVLTDAALTIGNNIGIMVKNGAGDNGALIAESWVGGNTAASSTFSGRIGWQYESGNVATFTGHTNAVANFAPSTHALVLSQFPGGRSTFTGEIASNNNLTGSNPANAALSSVIVASGGEVKLSNNANSYVGKTIVRNGTLFAGADGALGTATTAVQVGDTRTVAAAGASVRVAVSGTPGGTYTFNPTGGSNANGLLTWTASFNAAENPFDGVTLAVNDLVLFKDFNGTGTGTATSNPALNGIYRVLNNGATTAHFERVATVDSNYGTYVDVTAGNTYAGRRFYQGFGGTGTAVTLNSTPQAWQLDDTTYNASLITDGATTLGRNITVNAGSGTRSLGGASNQNSTFSGTVALGKDTTFTSLATGANRTTFSGIISGAGGVSKEGVGTVEFTAANGYTGLTTVAEGTLLANGSVSATGTGAVIVNTTGTLGGSGTISNTATLADGAKLAFNLSTNAAGHDKLDLGGLVNSGTTTVVITHSGGASPGTYVLATASGGISGSISTTPTLPSGWSGTVAVVGNNVELNLTSTGGGASPYETWASGFPGFTNTAPGVDFENDGIVNLLEFVFGGNPTINDTPSIRPTVTTVGTNLVISFKRSDISQESPLPTMLRVQVSSDLVTWNPADDIIISNDDFNGGGPNGTYTVDNSGSVDTIIVTIPQSGALKKFARVVAVR